MAEMDGKCLPAHLLLCMEGLQARKVGNPVPARSQPLTQAPGLRPSETQRTPPSEELCGPKLLPIKALSLQTPSRWAGACEHRAGDTGGRRTEEPLDVGLGGVRPAPRWTCKEANTGGSLPMHTQHRARPSSPGAGKPSIILIIRLEPLLGDKANGRKPRVSMTEEDRGGRGDPPLRQGEPGRTASAGLVLES